MTAPLHPRDICAPGSGFRLEGGAARRRVAALRGSFEDFTRP
jgi:hypothetical protein